MSTLLNRPFPRYEIHFLDVGDADCIAIKFQRDAESRPCVALIDAGNVSDAEKIKTFLKNQFGTTRINLAICTHPDSDHKGGFFGLLDDHEIIVSEFWLKAPEFYISDDDFVRMRKTESKQVACRSVYNHPTDSGKNLIDLVLAKVNKDGSRCVCHNVKCGCRYDFIPISVVGPAEDYYREAAIGIVQDFAELTKDPNTERYDEKDEISEEQAQSVIDEVQDESFTNKGSLVLYFHPTDDRRILLAGDASSASLRSILDANKSILKGCILKVPHHGSKHNLNTKLIDDLQPVASIISAAGTKKHPNPAIVFWLSKYGNVFSTHKSGGLYYSDCKQTSVAEPLRKKHASS